MSFWRRIFGRGEPPAEEEPPPEAPEAPEAPASEAPAGASPPEDPARALERLGDHPSPDLDVEEVLGLLERLRARGQEARAVDLARRVLSHHPEALPIHLRVAEILASRGDDAGAASLLAPFADRPDAPLDLLMLAAEIAERGGDAERALGLYERVVARDLDYPRARARVLRLREGQHRPQDLGATLMADGALTRGRYRVQRELGRGGAGTVFLAEDLALGREVALKVYHRRGRAERLRLLLEARAPARLEHPGIIRVFDLDEGLAAIAMERVRGGSVRREVGRGAGTLERARRWFQTAAEALAHVHERGLVHRDVKPSNMLLRGDDRVVLTDFGLAAEAGEAEDGRAGGAEGTLAYMPPEQRAGAPAAPAMDLHALGVSMREVLREVTGELPPPFAACVEACLRPDPERRPRAAWVAEQLEGR